MRLWRGGRGVLPRFANLTICQIQFYNQNVAKYSKCSCQPTKPDLFTTMVMNVFSQLRTIIRTDLTLCNHPWWIADCKKFTSHLFINGTTCTFCLNTKIAPTIYIYFFSHYLLLSHIVYEKEGSNVLNSYHVKTKNVLFIHFPHIGSETILEYHRILFPYLIVLSS